MSTKIYNGYRLTGLNVWDLREIMDVIHEVRKEMRKIQKQMSIHTIARYIAMEHDLAWAEAQGLVNFEARPCKIDGSKETSLVTSVRDWCIKKFVEAEKSQMRDPEFDFAAECSIFPEIPDVQWKGERILPVMLFCENRAMTKAWKDHPNITDWHYQNQVDEPAEISRQEWDLREECWMKHTFKAHETPAEAGLTATLSQQFMWMATEKDVKEIAVEIPSYDQRVRVLARQIASDEKAQEYLGDRESCDIPQQELFRMSHEISSWLHENAEKLLEEKRPTIEKFLPSDITMDTLLNPLRPTKVRE